MRNYDYWREYPYNMDRGHAVVVSEFPPHDWMEATLIKKPLWRKSGISGEDYYAGDFQCWRSCRLDEDTFMIRFEYETDYRAVVDTFPEIVIEANPFGPDLCPKCSGHAYPDIPIPAPAAPQGSYLSRVFKALIGVQ